MTVSIHDLDPHVVAAGVAFVALTDGWFRLCARVRRIADRTGEGTTSTVYNLVHHAVGRFICVYHGGHRLRDHYWRQHGIRADFHRLSRYS